MTLEFTEIIKAKSTDELLDIYVNNFLDYQEAFIQQVYEELTHARGVNDTQLRMAITQGRELSKNDYLSMGRVLYRQERTRSEIERFFSRYNLSTKEIDKLCEQLDEETRVAKNNDYMSQMLGGAFLLVLCLIIYMLGYKIVYIGSNDDVTWFVALCAIIAIMIGLFGYKKKKRLK